MLFIQKIYNKFLMRAGFKKYLANTSWLMAEKIFSDFLKFIVTVFVIRYLGPDKFGLISYAISFVTLFSAIVTLGLESIAVREMVKDKSRENELLGTVFVLEVIGALFVISILAIVLPFTDNDSYTNLLILIVAAALLFHPFYTIDYYFQARVLSKYSVFSRIGTSMIISILKLTFVYLRTPLIYFAIVIIVEGFFLAVGLTVFYIGQHTSLFKWKFTYATAKKILGDSWPLLFSAISITIYTKIDQVMIKQMLGTEAVGLYAAAARLSEMWNFVPLVICGSLFPAILNAKRISEKLYDVRLQRLYTLMTWIVIPIALVVTLTSDGLVRLLFGEEFSQAGSVLVIYIWSGLFVFLGVANGKYLIAENYTKIALSRTFTGMVVNIILNFIWIPKYGIQGAAIATVVSYCIVTFSVIFIPKTRKQAIMMLKSFNPYSLLRDFIIRIQR